MTEFTHLKIHVIRNRLSMPSYLKKTSEHFSKTDIDQFYNNERNFSKIKPGNNYY